MSDQITQEKPIEKIDRALDKRIYIRLKGKRAIKAILRSFDEHLNLFLEETIERYYTYDQEKDEKVIVENELDSIILRGDNVVFLTLDEEFEDPFDQFEKPEDKNEEIDSV
ncbi:MAG: LSM domain-containing protein [Promethearchaeota archaeon]